MASTMEIIQGGMACACKSWRMPIYCVWTPSCRCGDFLKWRVPISAWFPNCSPWRCMVVCLEEFSSMVRPKWQPNLSSEVLYRFPKSVHGICGDSPKWLCVALHNLFSISWSTPPPLWLCDGEP